MSEKVLKEFIRKYIQEQDHDEIIFSWQGGEPTLCGLDYFQTIVDLERQYMGDKIIQNDLQTNGTLLDDQWCMFLKEHNFLVGLSIDGPAHLHDIYRVTKDGRPTFNKVWRAVDPDDYGTFLCEVFDEWYTNDVGKTFVYNFECAIAQQLGIQGYMCVFGEICGKGLAIEHNGDVYSCDHFVYPEHRLGNITHLSLKRVVLSQKQKKFGFEKKYGLPQRCRDCSWLHMCRGGCMKHRFIRTPAGEPELNYLCSGFKKRCHNGHGTQIPGLCHG